jgi:hypothetical protein
MCVFKDEGTMGSFTTSSVFVFSKGRGITWTSFTSVCPQAGMDPPKHAQTEIHIKAVEREHRTE